MEGPVVAADSPVVPAEALNLTDSSCICSSVATIAGVFSQDDGCLLSFSNLVELPQEVIGIVLVEVALHAEPEEAETGVVVAGLEIP